jgi:ankyrin repeat protein
MHWKPSGIGRRLRYAIIGISLIMCGIAAIVRMSLHRPTKLEFRLTTAIMNNDPVAVRKLLEQGADPNSYRVDEDSTMLVNKGTERVLMTAAIGGNLEIVDLLVKHGANVNAECSDLGPRKCVLTYAIVSEKPEIVGYMLRHGANPNFKNGKGVNLLDEALIGDRTEVVRMLCAAGADVNSKDSEGLTALDWAKSCNARPETIGILSYSAKFPGANTHNR